MWENTVAQEIGWILLLRRAECWRAVSDRWKEEEPNTNISITAGNINKGNIFVQSKNNILISQTVVWEK